MSYVEYLGYDILPCCGQYIVMLDPHPAVNPDTYIPCHYASVDEAKMAIDALGADTPVREKLSRWAAP